MYAVMYAREFPAQALLRLRPELYRKPVAVMQGEAPREFVCSANELAYRQGVQIGMTRPQMELLEGIRTLARSVKEEEAARAVLLECAERFSPRVEELRFECACAIGTDIAGTEKLLGTPEQIVVKMREQAAAIGVAVSVAASCNFHAALCWAKAHPGTKVISSGEERRVLAPIPIDVLDLTLEQSVTFSLWGIHTLGELAALPQTELVARLGQLGKQFHELACGEHAHWLQPLQQTFELKEEIEFEAGVEALDSVMFVLSPMVQQLVLRAQSRALALASVTVACILEGGGNHTRTVRPVLPTLEHESLLKLIHLDLIANSPGAAVVGLKVFAEPDKPSRTQLGLFAPQFPEPMRLEVTLARLAAVVGGNDRVGAPELLDSNARESFRITRFSAPEETKAIPRAKERVGVRVLRPAEVVYVQQRNERPHQFVFRDEQYIVMECYGPWDLCGDWWGAEKWARRQWDVAATSRSGRPLCCQLSSDAQQWWVEALYD